jgi:hypothetical protein
MTQVFACTGAAREQQRLKKYYRLLRNLSQRNGEISAFVFTAREFPCDEAGEMRGFWGQI